MTLNAFARKHGVTPRLVRLLGGMDRLRALDPDAMALLLKKPYGDSRKLREGGLAVRGYEPLRRGIDTQKERGI